jgi:hypothetical protein
MKMVGSKARETYTALKKRIKVNEVYIGGGGGLEGDCRKMSLGWIRDCIRGEVAAATSIVDRWQDQGRWERLTFGYGGRG